MKDLIEVFRMDELDKKTRARVIIKLGDVINYSHGANIAEDIVYELVMILDPENEVIKERNRSLAINVKRLCAGGVSRHKCSTHN